MWHSVGWRNMHWYSFLSDAPHISQIALCLDHDKAGIEARRADQKDGCLSGDTEMMFPLFSYQKDWNEDLQALTEAAAGIYE